MEFYDFYEEFTEILSEIYDCLSPCLTNSISDLVLIVGAFWPVSLIQGGESVE